MRAPPATAASKSRWLARTFWRTYSGKIPPKLLTPGCPARWKTPSTPASSSASSTRSTLSTGSPAAFSSFSAGS